MFAEVVTVSPAKKNKRKSRAGTKRLPHSISNGSQDGTPQIEIISYARALRLQMYRCVTMDDFSKMVRRMVKEAKAGRVEAFREICDRLFGKANQPFSLADTDSALSTVVTSALATNPAALTALATLSDAMGRLADVPPMIDAAPIQVVSQVISSAPEEHAMPSTKETTNG